MVRRVGHEDSSREEGRDSRSVIFFLLVCVSVLVVSLLLLVVTIVVDGYTVAGVGLELRYPKVNNFEVAVPADQLLHSYLGLKIPCPQGGCEGLRLAVACIGTTSNMTNMDAVHMVVV